MATEEDIKKYKIHTKTVVYKEIASYDHYTYPVTEIDKVLQELKNEGLDLNNFNLKVETGLYDDSFEGMNIVGWRFKTNEELDRDIKIAKDLEKARTQEKKTRRKNKEAEEKRQLNKLIKKYGVPKESYTPYAHD